jgi:hypothetical protein
MGFMLGILISETSFHLGPCAGVSGHLSCGPAYGTLLGQTDMGSIFFL